MSVLDKKAHRRVHKTRYVRVRKYRASDDQEDFAVTLATIGDHVQGEIK